MPPYSLVNNSIDEQTGYSNSPKFSVYRLNNQSAMREGAAGFDDQVEQNAAERSQLFAEDVQNEYYGG